MSYGGVMMLNSILIGSIIQFFKRFFYLCENRKRDMSLMKITQTLEKREVGDKLVTLRVERAYALGIKVWQIEKIVETERIRRTTP